MSNKETITITLPLQEINRILSEYVQTKYKFYPKDVIYVYSDRMQLDRVELKQ